MSLLEPLGWSPFFQAQIDSDASGHRCARVVEELRGQYHVAGDFDGRAELSGRFRHEAKAGGDFPVVGDWVCVAGEPGGGPAIIHRRLERQGVVARKAAGPATAEQVIAANVDTIFLVTALTEDLSPRRLERYLAMVWESNAKPVIVLNKSDLSEDAELEAERIRNRLSLDDVVVLSALNDRSMLALERYVRPATTIALLGSSGVGKSTIVNRLLGWDMQRVSAIRASDGTGRHTTTSRRMIVLPSRALLIDTPGMRELQPWTEEGAIDRVFGDVAEIAQGCRFTDCSHTHEPGCAVLEAIAAGQLDGERLDHYHHLAREAAFEARKRDKAAAAEEKRRWKRLTQAHRARDRLRE